MTEITLDSTVVRSDEVLSSPVDDELVMIDLDSGKYFGLDAIGTDIWERLAEPTPVADLCAQLVTQYAVSEEACQADVLAILNDMSTEGLLELA